MPSQLSNLLHTAKFQVLFIIMPDLVLSYCMDSLVRPLVAQESPERPDVIFAATIMVVVAGVIVVSGHVHGGGPNARPESNP